MTQEQFLKELNQFITQHPYYIANEGTFTEHLPQNPDAASYNISDPDGDYEEIKIRIIHIA